MNETVRNDLTASLKPHSEGQSRQRAVPPRHLPPHGEITSNVEREDEEVKPDTEDSAKFFIPEEPSALPVSHAKFSIPAEDAADWKENLDAYKAGTLDLTKNIVITKNTPRPLTAIGADGLPVVIAPKVLRKVTEDEHFIPLDELYRTPENIHNPIAVFQSAVRGNAFVVMTDMMEGAKTVTAAIHLNAMEKQHEVHAVKSLYGKDYNETLVRWISEGRMLYMDKKKLLLWLRSRGLQLPKEGATKGTNSKLITKDDLVKPGSEDSLKFSLPESETDQDKAYLAAVKTGDMSLLEDILIKSKTFRDWFGDWQLASLIEQASNYVESSLDRKNTKDHISLGEVNPYLNKKLKAIFGFDIYQHEINANDLRHIINEHGDPKKESARNQVAVTPDALKIIPYILKNFDYVQPGSTRTDGRRSAKIVKRIDGKIIYVEVDTVKKGVLTSKTMYIAPSGRVNAIGPNHTSKTASSPSYRDMIQQILEDVKSKTSKVVDSDGKPLLVYHGTNAKLNMFKTKSSQASPYFWKDNDLGFFFDVDKVAPLDSGSWSGAAGYAGMKQKEGETIKPENARIVSAYLRLWNPMVYEWSDYIDAIKTAGNGSLLRQHLQELGYDGVIRTQPHNKKIAHVVAFSPSQIKSADPVTYDDAGNVVPLSKRFKPENPDIRFSLAGGSRTIRPDQLPDALSEVNALTTVANLTHKSKAKRIAEPFDAAKERGDMEEMRRIILETVPQNADEDWYLKYLKGKYLGDIAAAREILANILDERGNVAAELEKSLDKDKKTYFVPVINVEEPSKKNNQFPIAYAQFLANKFNGNAFYDIMKSKGKANTGATKKERFNKAIKFIGDIADKDAQYVIVDDNYTQGGTVYALIEHLIKQGADMRHVMTLGFSMQGKK